MVAFLTLVVAYCSAVYFGLYVVSYPIQLIVGHSWDILIASMVALRLHGKMLPRLPSRKVIAAMPPAEQEEAQRKKKAAARAYTKRRNLALYLCAAAAVLRWHQGWGDVRTLIAPPPIEEFSAKGRAKPAK